MMIKKYTVFTVAVILLLCMLSAGFSETIDPLFSGLRFGMTREEAEEVLARTRDKGLAYFTSNWEIFMHEEVYGDKFFYLTYDKDHLDYISTHRSTKLDEAPMFHGRSEKLRAVLGEPDYSMEKGTKAPADFRPEDPAIVSWVGQTEDASFTGADSFQSVRILNYEQWIVGTDSGDQWLIHHEEHEYRVEYVYEGKQEAYEGRQDQVELLPYTRADSAVSAADAAISLTVKNDQTVLTAGEKLSLKAAFANPKKMNRKEKEDRMIWELTDSATGKAPEDIKLDAKGANATLSVPKSLSEVRALQVFVFSPVFHTSAAWQVTLLPAVSGIAVEPAELFFYTGADTLQTVRVVLTPDTVPPIGLVWTPAKKDIVEIAEAEDGSISVRPLAAGKTAVTVKAPGGKSAKLNINVVEPVEAVELKTSGKTTPGSTVTVKETLLPKKAGNKAVEWSLDVGANIATIEKGKVKISGNAPAGTVITVTCTAIGAPEPVTASAQITVTEK